MPSATVVEVQRRAELDDRAGELGALPGAADRLDEGPVDLQRVDGEAGEVGQGRVARAEVVDREVDAQHGELLEQRDHLVGAFHEDGLGHLERQRRRGQAGVVEGAHDEVRQQRPHLIGRHVDRDGEDVTRPGRTTASGSPYGTPR